MKKYWVILIISILGLLLRFTVSGHGVFGDGNAYFAYAHALYFEHGLKFDGIYQHLDNFPGKKYTFSRIFWKTETGPFGVRNNPWTIGTGLFWLPAVAVVDVSAKLFGVTLDKFDIVYEFGIGVIGIIYSLLGLWWLEKYLNQRFDKKLAERLVIGLYLTTNLIYYVSLEPALSHQIIFCLLAGLLLWTSKTITSGLELLIVGVVMGLFTITRMADAILLIPIMYQLWINSRLRMMLWVGVGFGIGILPQLLTQYAMFGNMWQNPYFNGDNGKFMFNLINLWTALFSVYRGLFSWTPFLLLGIFGLAREAAHDRFIKIVLGSLILFWVAVSQWSGLTSAGYGSRLFVGSLPYFALGIGFVFKKFTVQKQWVWMGLGILFNGMVLNQFLIDPNRMVKNEGLTYLNFLTGNVTSVFTTVNKMLDLM